MKLIYTWSVKTLLVIFITTILFVGTQTFAKDTLLEQIVNNSSVTFLVESRVEDEIYKLVNAERKKRNLDSLAIDSRLAKLARSYSKQMANGNFFSHYDEDGDTVVERSKKFKISGWRKIGENLFTCTGYDDPAGIAIRGWLKSNSHRKNMLNRSWTHTGIGVARSMDGEIYVTQVFLTF